MNDPRLVELCKHAARLFPGRRFLVAFVPEESGEKLSTMANMPEPAQLELCRFLVRSFEGGRAEPQEELVLATERMK